MKHSMYSLLCLFLFSCGSTQEKEAQDIDLNDSLKKQSKVISDNVQLTSVDAIKSAFSNINMKAQNAQLDSVLIKYDCDGERAGTVTYFTESGQLKLIKHSYSEYSHFSAEDHYYINRDSVFFLYSKELVWSFESGKAAEGDTKDDITEKRVYISKEKAISCLEKKYIYRSKAKDNQRAENIQNKEVKCKSIEPIINNYGKLLAFKESKKQDCLGH